MNINTIYTNIKNSFLEQTGETVYDSSDLGIRMKIFASEMVNLYTQLEFCEKQLFPQTATGMYLERHGAIRNIIRKPADKARGVLKFSRTDNASQNIIIPANTLCTSSSGNGVMYATTEVATLAAGTNSILVDAEATEFGSKTNIIANKIDTIVNQIAGITTVGNPENFSGGCEIESEGVYRKRIVDSFLVFSNGANLKYYENLALANTNVYSAKGTAATTGGNAIDLYISDYFRGTSTTLIANVQAELNKGRALNTAITVKAATPLVQNINLTIYTKFLGDISIQKALAEDFLTEKMFNLGVGESFNPYLICEGLRMVIENLVDIKFNTPTESIPVAANQIIIPGQFIFTIERCD